MIGIIVLSAWIAFVIVGLCTMEEEECDFCEVEEGEGTWEEE